MLPLTFADPADYDRITTDCRISTVRTYDMIAVGRNACLAVCFSSRVVTLCRSRLG